MLLQITHLGADDEHRRRLYHVQTPRGLGAVVELTGADMEITLWLIGTGYRRTYPSPYPLEGIPRIRDLEGGYQTLQTFVTTWEHSTPEQRAILEEYESGIKWTRYDKKKRRKLRTKRKLRLTEDRPRHVPVKQSGDWHRAMVKDLRAALKGTLQADNIRIGGITVKRSVLYGLVNTKSALTRDPVLELRHEEGALQIRSADGRARVTVKHGAGDRYKGCYGWTRRVQLVAA